MRWKKKEATKSRLNNLLNMVGKGKMNEQELIEVIEKSNINTESKAELIEILELDLDTVFEGVKRR